MSVDDSRLVRILWILLVIGIVSVIWKVYFDKRTLEGFETTSDITEDIIDIYYKNLQRAPTAKELQDHTKAVLNKTYDYREIELRIINSDEYQRLIKTQTNLILPETKRVVEEKDLVVLTSRIYERLRNKKEPKTMYLPLKDMYIYFEYDLYRFVAFLRDKNYPEFEKTVIEEPKMTRDTMIELYQSLFDDSKLMLDAQALEKLDKSLPENKRLSYLLTAEKGKGGKAISAKDLNTSLLLSYLKDSEAKRKAEDSKQAEASALAAKKAAQDAQAEYDKYRKMLVSSTGEDCTTSQRVYLPNESKILKSDYGFQVLHKFPPVCVPIGKPATVSEPLIYSKLQGTPLDEADNTQVGSIMPKFEYRQYIEIPVAGTTKPPEPTKTTIATKIKESLKKD